jgi:hypothetical protein
MLDILKKHFFFILWIIVIGFCISSRILIGGDRTFLSGFDNSVQFYAWYTYGAKAIAQGSIPLWDFNQLSGHSFIGEMQSGVFYPWNLLLFFLLSRIDPSKYNLIASNIIESLTIIKLIFSAFFAYWMYLELKLSRFSAVIGAMIFAYSGFVFNRLSGQFCVFDSISWIPFIFAAYLKALKQTIIIKRLFWIHTTGIGLGMAILAGHYLGFIYGFLIVIGYSIYYFWEKISTNTVDKINLFSNKNFKEFKYILLGLIGVCLIGLLLASVQLLPTIEYSKLSVRFVNAPNPVSSGEKIPYSVLGDQFHFTPAGLLTILNPDFNIFNMGIGIDGFLYSGILSLVFGFLAIINYRKNYNDINFFIILLFLSLVYMLGGDSIFHAAYNILSPVADPVRTSSRISLLTHFAMSSLAAYGIQGIINDRNTQKINELLKPTLKNLLLTIILIPIAFLFFAPDKYNLLNSLFMTLVLAIVTSWFLILWTNNGENNKLYKKYIFILVCSLVLAQDSYYFLVTNGLPKPEYEPPGLLFPPEVVKNYSSQLLSLKDAKNYYRISNFEPPELKNFGDVLGIKMTMAHGASLPKNYFSFLGDLGWKTQHLYDLLSAKYIISPVKENSKQIIIQENPSALPIFRLYYNYLVIPDIKTARKKLNDPLFPYRNTVIVSEAPVLKTSSDLNSTNTKSIDNTVVLLNEKPNQVSLSVQSSIDGILVFADQSYPGWKAYVNNKRVQLFTADTVFKAIAIPQGKSEVVFKYRPVSLIVGLFLTIFISFSYIVLLGTNLRRDTLP